MIFFIHGEDSYRSKKKIEEIIEGYKKIHTSGLNLIYVDAEEKSFNDFYANFKVNSMFAEKKLVIVKNIFEDKKFQEDFLEKIESLKDLKDIILVYEEKPADQRTKLFKVLQKSATCQEFKNMEPAVLKKWIANEFDKKNTKIDQDALNLLVDFVKSDLWRMANEINKLSDYKKGSVIKKLDVELSVKPDIENDIFKTIDALVSNKKQALFLFHKHLENGDSPLYLLSMISYQIKNLLAIKELQDMSHPYGVIVKKSGLHPFVVQKSCHLCGYFSMDKLKKIYQDIFKIDLDIKTGKVDPELAIDLLVATI